MHQHHLGDLLTDLQDRVEMNFQQLYNSTRTYAVT